MLRSGMLVNERYRIDCLIGQGAMGAVYAAVDLRLGQMVALKHTLIPSPEAAASLDREAQILAQLNHPGLPGVSDTFAAGDGQCMVMTYVAGSTLADMLDIHADGFGLDVVLAWADQILATLEYLHTREPAVLHRDIKPHNLKLTADGRIVLLDFGLARGQLFQTQRVGWRSVVGYTLPYAPLEQVRGQDTDPRSDLFALAGTLYHLLIGTPPPDALERAAAMLAGQADPLCPPHVLQPAIPRRMSRLLVAALALDPARRPASARAMRLALRSVGTPVALPLALPRPFVAGWLRWAGAHTLAVIVLSIVSVLLQHITDVFAVLLGQGILAMLFCFLHGATICTISRRSVDSWLMRMSIATVTVYPWLLSVPLSLGLSNMNVLPSRIIAVALAGVTVVLALRPVTEPDGRVLQRIGASALTWALTILVDSSLGYVIPLESSGAMLIAAASGLGSGAIGGLGGGLLAVRGWLGFADPVDVQHQEVLTRF
ncbi:MAG: serine/threonine protein kinase [Oscillochloris sp.]|nr:serine/threonine protein kinase [Oscillochloris sp.]